MNTLRVLFGLMQHKEQLSKQLIQLTLLHDGDSLSYEMIDIYSGSSQIKELFIFYCKSVLVCSTSALLN